MVRAEERDPSAPLPMVKRFSAFLEIKTRNLSIRFRSRRWTCGRRDSRECISFSLKLWNWISGEAHAMDTTKQTWSVGKKSLELPVKKKG